MERCWGCSETPASPHRSHSDTQEHLLPIPAWMARGSLSVRGCTNIHPNAARAATEKNNTNLHSASGWSLESAARITENTAIKLTNLSTQTCIYPDFSRAMSMSKPGRPHRQILDAGITWDSSFHLFLQCTKIIRIGHGKTPPFFLCFQKQPNPFSQLLLLHCCFSFFNLITSSMNNFQHGKFLPKELKLA